MPHSKSLGDFDVVSGPPAPSRPIPPALPQPAERPAAVGCSEKPSAPQPKQAPSLAKPAGRL